MQCNSYDMHRTKSGPAIYTFVKYHFICPNSSIVYCHTIIHMFVHAFKYVHKCARTCTQHLTHSRHLKFTKKVLLRLEENNYDFFFTFIISTYPMYCLDDSPENEKTRIYLHHSCQNIRSNNSSNTMNNLWVWFISCEYHVTSIRYL